MHFCNSLGDWQRARRRNDQVIDDAALAAELNALSVQEREHIYDVVHGVVSTIVEETPEMVTKAFNEMKEEIQNIPRRRRKEYDRAVFLKPSLDNDVDFHLMFIRADSFNCRKAANRICKYFTNKLDLFGDEKLARSITLDDLNEDDLEAIRSGSHRVLEQRDRSGRRIWLTCFSKMRFKHPSNQVGLFRLL